MFSRLAAWLWSRRLLCHQFMDRDEANAVVLDVDRLCTVSTAVARRFYKIGNLTLYEKRTVYMPLSKE